MNADRKQAEKIKEMLLVDGVLYEKTKTGRIAPCGSCELRNICSEPTLLPCYAKKDEHYKKSDDQLSSPLPEITEEEIKHKLIAHSFNYEDESGVVMSPCVKLDDAITILSRLPERKEQKTTEEVRSKISKEIKRVIDLKDDGCHNCSVKDCKVYSSGKKCGNWHGYIKS
jgi:hypothetical protein